MPGKNLFAQKVYEVTRQIPRGKVATYGQIAELSGSKKAARAVGRILHSNSNPALIPCHRVVASDGSLGGYAFGGIEKKKELLLAEGVRFKKDKVDLSLSGWCR